MANEYLKRTPTSTGNRKVFTISVWAKLNNNSNNNVLCDTNTNGANFLSIRIGTSGVQSVLVYQIDGATDYSRYWNLAERDFSAWSHHLFVFNSPAVDAGDRLSYYINGIKITNYSDTYGTFPQNFDFKIDTTRSFDIFRNLDTGGYGQGELYDYFFIDGQALTPDVFGFYKVGKGYVSAGSTQSTDFRPGQWVPKTPRVIKTAINNNGGFGVNGFYLPMNDSNNFGADFHCDPNSIIKLQENLPQPRCRIDGVGDYTGALRDDPFKQYLVLALPFVSGGLQSGFGDYSAAIKGSGSPKSITVTGTVSIANTASYYGSAALFNATSAAENNLLTVNNAVCDFGTGDFTVEVWGYPFVIDTGNNNYIMETTGLGGTRFAIVRVGGENIGEYYLVIGNNVYTITGTNYGINQWHHLAVCRKNGVVTAYLNGVATYTNTITTDITAQSGVYIGSFQPDASFIYEYQGYLQDLRVYKGVAKYTGGFDVPRPYTPVGIATWRAVPDSPANNFATWNAIDKTTGGTLSDGNLTFVGGAGNHGAPGTIGFSTGKYYTEMYINDAPATNSYFGILDTRGSGAGFTIKNFYAYQYNSGNKYGGEEGTFSQTSYGNSVTTGDIISMAVDMVNKKIFFAKNGVWQNSSDPVSGTNSAFTIVTTNESFYIPWNNSNAAHTRTTNFGQNPTFSGNTTAGTYTDSNNKGLFKYQPPSGFLALCEDNLPTPAISDPGKHFRTVLYRGSGASRNLVGIGFTPDLVWIKGRDVQANNHVLFDSVRGATSGGYLMSAQTSAESPNSTMLLSFDNDGFSLGSDNTSAANNSSINYVAWCWKAGAGTTSTNTNGSITSVVSVNQDAGFSIVSWTGAGSGTSTVGHGLGKQPAFIITKARDSASDNSWIALHKSAGTSVFSHYLYLNSTAGANPLSPTWPATSTIFTTTPGFNSAVRYISYCWAEIEGFSKFGSYTGNNSTDGPFCYCGFRPAWVMIKNISGSHNWEIYDSSMNPINPVGLTLLPNTSDAQIDTTPRLDFLSNGFKWRNIGGSVNGSGNTIIFAAFAESPFQTANAK